MFRAYCLGFGLVCVACGITAIVVAVQAQIHGLGGFAVGGCAGLTMAWGFERILEGVFGVLR